MNTFGNYLSRKRKVSGMTQEQLANKMGVTNITIQNWERGRTKVKPAHLKELAYLFNVPETELIAEMNRENDSMRRETFPECLLEDDEQFAAVIGELHLNFNQQELFGLICLYCQDLLQGIDQKSAFNEAVTRIPYEFVCKVGSIQFMNLLDGLRNVLKYVNADFLLKVLKLYPDELFDVTRLPRELIVEFLDSGHVPYTEYDSGETAGFDLGINMKKAAVVLPILEKGAVHLSDGMQSGTPLRTDVPQEIINASWCPPGQKCLLSHVTNGLRGITAISLDKSTAPVKCYLQISEKGKALLRWFQKKE